MTARLYTKYQPLNNLTSTSNQFTETPILDDWQIKRDWNKAGSLTFKSPEKLQEGTHVKLESPDHRTFGGMIVKPAEQANDFYSYDCLDYKRFLLISLSKSFTNKRASDIVKWLKKQVDNSILTWKITNTKNVYSSLAWKDTTVLEIISQLLNLEYKKGTLIYFDVDETGKLTFKPYPEKVEGYSLSDAFDYTNSIDYTDIATGYTLYDTDNSVLKTYDNTSLQAIWGSIDVSKSLGDTSTSKSSNSDDDIKKIVASINKSMRGIKHRYNGGSMDCYEMSEAIFKKLKANKVTCKVPQYYSANSNSKTHRSVIVKYSTGWKDFDYKGMETGFGPNFRSLKSSAWQKVVFHYP